VQGAGVFVRRRGHLSLDVGDDSSACIEGRAQSESIQSLQKDRSALPAVLLRSRVFPACARTTNVSGSTVQIGFLEPSSCRLRSVCGLSCRLDLEA
jgi:hypothetical protein